MGCCELERQTDKGEQFIQDTVKQFKISCMDLKNLKETLSDLSTIREKIDKNVLIVNLDKLRNNNNLYESRLFETILNHLKDTFTVNELLFYLLPFTKNKNENPFSDLYELFISIKKDEKFTAEVLEKLISDYLRFFTSRINYCFSSSLLETEPEEIKVKVNNLNERVYNKNNFRVIINSIIGLHDDKEEITFEIFTSMLSDYKIYDFINIRSIFISNFEEI